MESEELLKARERKQKLESNRFKQQTLPAWRPVPTLISSLITFLIFGVIFLTLGIVLIEFTKDIKEVKVRYENKCSGMTNCALTFTVDEKMEGTVYVYYQLDNFYQNHRRYVKSVSYTQLGGSTPSVSELDDCDPIITNGDLGFANSYGGTALVSSEPANPCGLIARSFFNDTYSITGLTINESDIAWDSDVEYKFDKPSNSANIQWIDPTNEHFIVWMRTAGMPNFRKLWGRITDGVPAGTYTLNIVNNYNVDAYDAKKTFIISTTNAFGGKNYFLSI